MRIPLLFRPGRCDCTIPPCPPAAAAAPEPCPPRPSPPRRDSQSSPMNSRTRTPSTAPEHQSGQLENHRQPNGPVLTPPVRHDIPAAIQLSRSPALITEIIILAEINAAICLKSIRQKNSFRPNSSRTLITARSAKRGAPSPLAACPRFVAGVSAVGPPAPGRPNERPCARRVDRVRASHGPGWSRERLRTYRVDCVKGSGCTGLVARKDPDVPGRLRKRIRMYRGDYAQGSVRTGSVARKAALGAGESANEPDGRRAGWGAEWGRRPNDLGRCRQMILHGGACATGCDNSKKRGAQQGLGGGRGSRCRRGSWARRVAGPPAVRLSGQRIICGIDSRD